MYKLLSLRYSKTNNGGENEILKPVTRNKTKVYLTRLQGSEIDLQIEMMEGINALIESNDSYFDSFSGMLELTNELKTKIWKKHENKFTYRWVADLVDSLTIPIWDAVEDAMYN